MYTITTTREGITKLFLTHSLVIALRYAYSVHQRYQKRHDACRTTLKFTPDMECA